MKTKDKSEPAKQLRQFLLSDFSPDYGNIPAPAETDPRWEKLLQTGSQLWLDTGNIEQINRYKTEQFTAVTTNNTLLNKEVQSGIYDDFIEKVADILDGFELNEKEKTLELAFALNARHGLRLVEKFDAFVSVEEHTDLAEDISPALEYARRYHRLCPERFIVKIPFTPAGLLTTRKLSAEGIPVNHTLGFSARQNYIITRIAGPDYVNVFLGRLNSFVADNNLGSGEKVGEKAALASNQIAAGLRAEYSCKTRQIAASLRDAGQLINLAGTDVITMPPKVAAGFLDGDINPEDITDKTSRHYSPGINPAQLSKYRLDDLWQVPGRLVKCLDKLDNENLDSFSAEDLVSFFADSGCGDILIRWSREDKDKSAGEGKIPKLPNWSQRLADGEISIDALMNLAGLESFTTDQRQMDKKIKEVLSK